MLWCVAPYNSSAPNSQEICSKICISYQCLYSVCVCVCVFNVTNSRLAVRTEQDYGRHLMVFIALGLCAGPGGQWERVATTPPYSSTMNTLQLFLKFHFEEKIVLF